jgi:translation elongation factor EF-G
MSKKLEMDGAFVFMRVKKGVSTTTEKIYAALNQGGMKRKIVLLISRRL